MSDEPSVAECEAAALWIWKHSGEPEGFYISLDQAAKIGVDISGTHPESIAYISQKGVQFLIFD